MTRLETTVERNYQSVCERIAAAATRAGRSADDVKLVAVTKYAEVEWVRALVNLGVTELGENRPQQLQERAELIAGPVHWHLIGHLQRNKVRRMLPTVSLIHSVDSVRLLAEIEKQASELQLESRVLLEVNLTGEEQKHGFRADDLAAQWGDVIKARGVRIEGLMAMAAYSDNPDDARPVFKRLRELRDQLAVRSPSDMPLAQLSMGMTGDFEIAIEEGATLVRIGSALWDGL